MTLSVRTIAMYLPQYHPIPENDLWWGKGFTEWRNVAKAQPLFPGHYQPHIPADLGYYDLRLPETRIAQADLAREYGIHGFCYYHYWFNGKRLLERPFSEVLQTGEPDFPFCLCWANENWTRRWDGHDQEILIKQEYSLEDDREHIRSLFIAFEDRRYIRINDKPLFLVYRTEWQPDPKATAEVWREEALKAGLGEIFLVRVESMSSINPFEIGFDAALEFAPDWHRRGKYLRKEMGLLERFFIRNTEVCEAYNSNYISYYDDMVADMLSKPIPDYPWYRCATPSWDNTARRKNGANIFLDSTPEKFKFWLDCLLKYTRERFTGSDSLLFINAWNEWAEGNHLEPDLKTGHGYLEAVKNALM